MKTKIMLTVGLILLLAAISGYGQQTKLIKAKIDFPFTIEGKVLPAGQYELMRDDPAMSFRVQGEGMNSGLAIILTRITGEMHASPNDSHIVFDKVGDTYFLSEIWIQGEEDGYLLYGSKNKHEHKVYTVKD